MVGQAIVGVYQGNLRLIVVVILHFIRIIYIIGSHFSLIRRRIELAVGLEFTFLRAVEADFFLRVITFALLTGISLIILNVQASLEELGGSPESVVVVQKHLVIQVRLAKTLLRLCISLLELLLRSFLF